MLRRHRAVGTLDRLVAKPTDGLLFLAKIGRLDISAEEIALKPKYESIVSEETRARAENLRMVRG